MAPPNFPEAKTRHFSVEEANRALPLVRLIVGDIVRQFRVVSELEQRIASVRSRAGKRAASDPYWEEVEQSRAELDAEKIRLAEYFEELGRLGVELKGPDGLCDFPSLRDGREVYLCWRPDEPEVLYWHEIDAGFSGRQPLRSSGQ